jgi:Na+/H+ antiporter
MSSIQETQLLLLLLLLFVVGFGSVAKWISVPYPIVLVVAGLLLSFVPQLPRFKLNADFVFIGVLPPLLFSAAFTTSWRDFRYNLFSILLLAFGLVGFTVAGVAIMAHMLLPWFDWRLGLVLGAVVATTDAIAATSIAKRVGLPQRIIDILEGESLVNDASGLLALEFATALVVSGRTPSFWEGATHLIWLLIGGVVTGLVIAKLVDIVERKLDDAPIEVTLSLVVPYVAYLGAEAIHCSGVLSAVAAGLYLGKRSAHMFSSAVRIETRSFWNTFTFILNGLVFLLIGLQLPIVLAGTRSRRFSELVLDAAEFIVAVILLRLLWVFPAAYAGYFAGHYILEQRQKRPSIRGVFVIGWTGMRGVIALAAAISLPHVLSDGRPFPERDVIIFLTFCIILVTLVVQGLSLPILIRKLGLARKKSRNPEEQMARRKMVNAALEELEHLQTSDGRRSEQVYEDIARYYARRLAAAADGEDEASDQRGLAYQKRYHSVSNHLRKVERATAIQLRDGNEISDSVLHKLERELDLLDARFEGMN